jgi:hypothetical protein
MSQYHSISLSNLSWVRAIRKVLFWIIEKASRVGYCVTLPDTARAAGYLKILVSVGLFQIFSSFLWMGNK